MAWSSRTLVIAFRGTAAAANIWSDAKVDAPVSPKSVFYRCSYRNALPERSEAIPAAMQHPSNVAKDIRPALSGIWRAGWWRCHCTGWLRCVSWSGVAHGAPPCQGAVVPGQAAAGAQGLPGDLEGEQPGRSCAGQGCSRPCRQQSQPGRLPGPRHRCAPLKELR